MKSKLSLIAIVLGLVMPHAAKASKVVLPDACGVDKVSYDVDTDKKATGTKLPDAKPGKAQLVLLETLSKNGEGHSLTLTIGGSPNYTTRFGLDGNWVGAAKGNTYSSWTSLPASIIFAPASKARRP